MRNDRNQLHNNYNSDIFQIEYLKKIYEFLIFIEKKKFLSALKSCYEFRHMETLSMGFSLLLFYSK